MHMRYLSGFAPNFVPALNVHQVSIARLAFFAMVLLRRSAHPRALSFQIEGAACEEEG